MVIKMRELSLTSGIVSTAKSKKTPRINLSVSSVAELMPWPKELEDGRCKGYRNADVFSSPFTEDDLAEAKSVCAGCPIKFACYEIGVSRQEEGVYGGVYLYRGEPGVLPKYRARTR